MFFMIEKKELTNEPTRGLLVHDNETLEWAVTMFRKSTGPVQDDDGRGKKTIDFKKVLGHINEYWASLPKPHQTEIFNIYKRIKEFFNLPFWENEIVTLYDLVAELYTYHDIKKVFNWMVYHDTSIRCPEYLREEFVQYNGYTCETAEKTYTRADYMELLALAISIRAMIPVWGEYFVRTKGAVRNTFKEYHALKLINRAGIFHSKPVERLKVYIEHNLPPTLPPGLTLNAGISIDEYPTYMLSMLLIRKLMIVDLGGVDKKTSVIASIHSYMLEKNKHGPESSGVIRSYMGGKTGPDVDNNLSVLERATRIKQVIPTGYFVMLEVPFDNPLQIARSVCPDIPEELVTQSLKSSTLLREARIHDPQIAVASWVLAYNNTVVPRALQYLPSKVKVLSVALSIAQALLYHKGFDTLAPLMTAVEQIGSENYGGDDSRSRVTKEQVEKIEVLFPLVSVTGRSGNSRKNNRVLECIEDVAGKFDEVNWRANLAGVFNPSGVKELYVPTNIKPLLADLIIRLNTKSF